MRGQKGITLVALIITIVILLILATVAITSMDQYNIIGNANKAKDAYGEAVNKEDEALKGLETDLNTALDFYNKNK